MGKTAYIIITSKCNSACEYCFYRQEPERYTKDRIYKNALAGLVDSLKKYKFNEITITGGEPLLKKDIVYRILDLSKDNMAIKNLNTNGTLLEKETIKKLSHLNLSNLFLPSEFLKKDPELIDLAGKYFRLYFIHVITKSNLEDLKDFINKAGKDNLNLILQPVYVNKRNNELFEKLSLKTLDISELNELKNNLDFWAKTAGKRKYVDLIFNYYSNKGELPRFCHLAENDIIIEANGNVLPCFHKRDLIAGNIFEDNFDDIMKRHDLLKNDLFEARCFGEHCISLFY